MAKKKQSKKHKFKYTEPTTSFRNSDVADSGSSAHVKFSATANGSQYLKPADGYGRDFSYVVNDLRRIVILGGSLVVAEVALWYLFAHTGLGSAVYSLVKV